MAVTTNQGTELERITPKLNKYQSWPLATLIARALIVSGEHLGYLIANETLSTRFVGSCEVSTALSAMRDLMFEGCNTWHGRAEEEQSVSDWALRNRDPSISGGL
jgi:hypothetical protein